MTSVVAAIAGSAAIALPRASPSIPGIIMSRIATRKGCPFAAAPRSRSSAPSASRAWSWRQRIRSSMPAITRWFVALSSTTRIFIPVMSAAAGIGCSVFTCLPSLAVNQNVDPLPVSLSTPTVPPMRAARRCEMERPSPEPPKRRVVDESTCVNGWKSIPSFSLGNADARIADGELQQHALVVLLRNGHLQDDLSALRELHGIADQVGDHLPQAAGVAFHPRGRSRIDHAREFQPLLVRPERQHVVDVLQRAAEVEVQGLQVQLAGIDLREVEDVVDQRQQRLGARPDGVGVLALLVVEASFPAEGWTCR